MLEKLLKVKFKIVAIAVGLFSLIWFLIRVVPKPSRATYPCQRAAFPFASTFVIWLTGLLSGKYFFKKARNIYSGSNYLLATLFLIASVFSFSLVSLPTSTINASFNIVGYTEDFKPDDNPNNPIGKAKGIYPGRVVWCYNPNATNWNGLTGKKRIDGKSGATSPNPEGNWFLEGNIIQSQVDLMMAETIRTLTGKGSDALAWDAIFKYFNSSHQKGNIGYKSGEKIAIKINLNNSSNHNTMDGTTNITPQMVLSLLRQLVLKANVPAEFITFYDVSRQIPSTIYDLCKKEFPNVKFVDKIGGDGRIKAIAELNNPIIWSQVLNLEPLSNPAYTAYLPTCVTEAEYIVNFANLKGHSLAGITLCSKNMFGSFLSPNNSGLQPPEAAGVHPYIAVKNSEGYIMRPMKSYNALVDLMGNNNLGGKSLILFIDGLIAAPWQSATLDYTCKWESTPFNGNFTSSLFASFDIVALESVCLDFLRSEQAASERMTQITGNVDNYLHEAALANDPPSGTFYHPNGNVRLESLGVHEHWNNAAEKLYTRNLKTGDGIELLPIIHTWGVTTIEPLSENENLTIFPNPSSDFIKIRFSNQLTGECKLEIYSTNGTLLYFEYFNKDTIEFTHEVDIRKFRGLLILKVSLQKYQYSEMIIKK